MLKYDILLQKFGYVSVQTILNDVNNIFIDDIRLINVNGFYDHHIFYNIKQYNMT